MEEGSGKHARARISPTTPLRREPAMSAETAEKKTPLYDTHVAEGGKIVPFAGYLLPVQYGAGLVAEHEAVRTKCGLFDVSHMGEVTFSGPGALATLNHLLTNDFTSMTDGRARYSVMCYDDGGCVDDVIVYRFGPESYYVVVNAANKDKDVAWMSDHLLADTEMKDISDGVAQLALQGPASPEILAKLVAPEGIPEKYYTAIPNVDLCGMNVLVSRTGYTGEMGYEIYSAAEDAPAIWKKLREAGEEYGLIPCGLGARDTLRMEAAMPLYGHEMDETVTPLEAGLSFAVKMDMGDFIGRDALVEAGDPKRRRVGLWATGRGIIREEEDVYLVADADGSTASAGKKIGETTSGTHCPHIKHAVAMALVDAAHAEVGTQVEVDVRGRRVAAEMVALPFYKSS